jgi:hypothetical protein
MGEDSRGKFTYARLRQDEFVEGLVALRLAAHE